MRRFNKGLTGFLVGTAFLGGLLLFGGARDANAQMMGENGWMPAVQTTGPNQAGYGYGHGYGPGHGRGQNGMMHGYARTNTAAGYHNGHGPHSGPYQGCGW